MECTHEHTHREVIENTGDYEYSQAQGGGSVPLLEEKIEVCDDCGAQRDYPELNDEWTEAQL